MVTTTKRPRMLNPWSPIRVQQRKKNHYVVSPKIEAFGISVDPKNLRFQDLPWSSGRPQKI
jgi:hypothetical protein